MVDAAILTGDDLRVAQWREERFLSLGFTDMQAGVLARGDSDWHEAAALVAAGCPVDIVYRIVT
jgi:hypothetical protein